MPHRQVTSPAGKLHEGDGTQALVVIVDDDETLRLSLQDLFASVGLSVAMFGSAAELLAAGIPEDASCLVLDLRLPGASGLEFQRQLAGMGLSIPIIFITGHADVHTSVRAMKAGAIDFLPKPFRDQELLDAVMKAVEGDATRREQNRELAELRACAQQLSPREIDVLQAVRRGLLNKQIAFELGIAEITAKMHRSNAVKKLKASSIADLVRKIELLKL